MQNQILKFNQRHMAETIRQMKEFFQEETETLHTNIKVNTERFTEQDVDDFYAFLQELQQENMQKLSQFWDQKAGSKTITFEKYNETFQVNFAELLQNMAQYKNDLTNFFTQAKQKELQLEEQIDSLVLKQLKQNRIKRSFKIWKDYIQKRQLKQQALEFSDRHYIQNLQNKSFSSWRSISYKPAYEEKIFKSSEEDVNNVQKHYIDIINVLKTKIQETDDLIEVKKQAKAEFAYSLSKNLMKAISNLSMEVMSLNQLTLNDQRVDTSDTQKFIEQINTVVGEKCQQINDVRVDIKKNIIHDDKGVQSKKGSVITFQPANLEKVSLYRDN